MSNHTSSISVPWVKDIPDHIKSTYSRLVLIDGDVTISDLPKDDDTLFITTNWTSWCRSLKDKKHCLHYEAGLFDWVERGAPVNSYIEETLASLGSQSEDPTLFKGVSILDSLQSVTIGVGRIFLRLDGAMDFFIRKFKPNEIIFHSMTFEMHDLPSEYTAKAVEIISFQHGCSFKDISKVNEFQRHGLPQEKSSSFSSSFKKFIRKALIELYIRSISTISWLRKKLSPQKDNILLQPTGAMIKPLIKSYNNGSTTPILLARQNPKSLTLIMQSIWKGVLFVESPICRNNARSKNVTQSIIHKLDQAWALDEDRTSSFSKFMRYFVRKHLIETGRFQEVVEQIFAYDTFIEIHRIRRIVSSGFLSTQAMIFLQLAREKNIPTDEVLHGLRVNHQQYPQLRRQSAASPLVSRLLAWGQQNADWLSDLESETKVVYTGYPGMPEPPPRTKPSDSKDRNKALVLPFEPDKLNIIGLHSHSFAALAEIINVLISEDYDVTVKVHPSLERKTYDDLVELFKLNCKVIQNGDLIGLAENADIVVGPMNSGAMIQTLAIGKPYYPCTIPPTSHDSSYILNHQPSADGKSLADALRYSRCLDNKKILAYFCGTNTSTENLNRFWQAMAVDNIESISSQESDSLKPS